MKAKHLFYTLFIFLFSLTSCENEANIDLLLSAKTQKGINIPPEAL